MTMDNAAIAKDIKHIIESLEAVEVRLDCSRYMGAMWTGVIEGCVAALRFILDHIEAEHEQD